MSNELMIKKLTIDSREVSEMVEKKHSELLKDIRRYIGYLAGVDFHLGDFFAESTYLDKNNQERLCYQITKKGCEFIAHKLTGQKGSLFTANYINRFHEMQTELERPRESYMIDNPIERAKAWILEQQEKEQLKLTATKQQQVIGELKPKADYVDRILKNKGLVTITQIAKDYGMSGQAMNKLLHELRVQYKQSDQWLLYRGHHGKGYTHSETIDIIRSDGSLDIKMNTKWTQRGRIFLYNLLKENNVLPVIEQEVA